MRAAVLRGGTVETRETADPVPGPGHVLLEVLSCAICASDLHFMDNPEAVADDDTGMWDYREDADIVMGHEFLGKVIGHGPSVDVDAFPLGAHVTSLPVLTAGGARRIIGCSPDAPGGFGELMLVQDVFARVVPPDVAVDRAALVDAFAVGEYYVRNSGIDTSAVPLVIGAGAIGLSAVAALARRGLSPVVVADFNAARLATAREFGATHTVDPRERSPYDLWHEVALGDREAPGVMADEPRNPGAPSTRTRASSAARRSSSMVDIADLLCDGEDTSTPSSPVRSTRPRRSASSSTSTACPTRSTSSFDAPT
jgi:threonine dehydrogenase-like Zn-dependent dehydrogenase